MPDLKNLAPSANRFLPPTRPAPAFDPNKLSPAIARITSQGGAIFIASGNIDAAPPLVPKGGGTLSLPPGVPNPKPAGRLGDKAHVPEDRHGCAGDPHSCIGPAIAGSPNVNINGRPALRVADNGIHAACCGSNTWYAQEGSGRVFINNRCAHRMGDLTVHCGGLGKLVEGSANVLIA